MVSQVGEEAEFETTAEVLNARKLRIIAESVCKCDAVDARVLNELARSNFKLPTCYMPDDEEFALREHLRARSALVRLRTTVKNRIHAVLHRRAIPRGKPIAIVAVARRMLEDALTLLWKEEAFRFVPVKPRGSIGGPPRDPSASTSKRSPRLRPRVDAQVASSVAG